MGQLELCAAGNMRQQGAWWRRQRQGHHQMDDSASTPDETGAMGALAGRRGPSTLAHAPRCDLHKVNPIQHTAGDAQGQSHHRKPASMPPFAPGANLWGCPPGFTGTPAPSLLRCEEINHCMVVRSSPILEHTKQQEGGPQYGLPACLLFTQAWVFR